MRASAAATPAATLAVVAVLLGSLRALLCLGQVDVVGQLGPLGEDRDPVVRHRDEPPSTAAIIADPSSGRISTVPGASTPSNGAWFGQDADLTLDASWR